MILHGLDGFPRLVDGDQVSQFPCRGNGSSFPGYVDEVKQVFLASVVQILQHFIGDSVRSRSFFGPEGGQGRFELMEGEGFSEKGGVRSRTGSFDFLVGFLPVFDIGPLGVN